MLREISSTATFKIWQRVFIDAATFKIDCDFYYFISLWLALFDNNKFYYSSRFRFCACRLRMGVVERTIFCFITLTRKQCLKISPSFSFWMPRPIYCTLQVPFNLRSTMRASYSYCSSLSCFHLSGTVMNTISPSVNGLPFASFFLARLVATYFLCLIWRLWIFFCNYIKVCCVWMRITLSAFDCTLRKVFYTNIGVLLIVSWCVVK